VRRIFIVDFLRSTKNYGSSCKKKVPLSSNTTVAGKNNKLMPDLI
jgi:hypothetical protein